MLLTRCRKLMYFLRLVPAHPVSLEHTTAVSMKYNFSKNRAICHVMNFSTFSWMICASCNFSRNPTHARYGKIVGSAVDSCNPTVLCAVQDVPATCLFASFMVQYLPCTWQYAEVVTAIPAATTPASASIANSGRSRNVFKYGWMSGAKKSSRLPKAHEHGCSSMSSVKQSRSNSTTDVTVGGVHEYPCSRRDAAISAHATHGASMPEHAVDNSSPLIASVKTIKSTGRCAGSDGCCSSARAWHAHCCASNRLWQMLPGRTSATAPATAAGNVRDASDGSCTSCRKQGSPAARSMARTNLPWRSDQSILSGCETNGRGHAGGPLRSQRLQL